MKLIFNKFSHFLTNVESKIAFYPTLISLLGLALSFLIIYLENMGISSYFRDTIPGFVINDADTARTLLSTLIAGLISLMVFSFSMVMILLNQASNNFSPRLLPGLISNRRHQLVLGIFLASLIYCIFILVTIETSDSSDKIPGFSVLLSIILTLVCLGTFVYFIHSISQSIQVSTILEKIQHTTKSRLHTIIENTKGTTFSFPDTKDWNLYYARKTGYLQDVFTEALLSRCTHNETRIHILPPKGSYILEGVPIFRSEKELEEEEVKKVLDALLYSNSELLEDNYVLGFKQITEIAVKAMSPGINDPGTALNAIDYLTELFALRMQKTDISILGEKDRELVKLNAVSFSELIYNVMASLRLYCKHDVIIVQKLLLMLRYLLYQKVAEKGFKDDIKREIKTLLKDGKNAISNEEDLKTITELAEKINL